MAVQYNKRGSYWKSAGIGFVIWVTGSIICVIIGAKSAVAFFTSMFGGNTPAHAAHDLTTTVINLIPYIDTKHYFSPQSIFSYAIIGITLFARITMDNATNKLDALSASERRIRRQQLDEETARRLRGN